jgi:ribokinase
VDARAYDVVVVGKANMDYLVRGPRLPLPGQSVNGDLFHEGPGGKGANQAVAAARLGARVALISRIGNDARGDLVMEALLNEGIAVDYVVRDPSRPTGVALCQVGGSGEKQILSAAGANAHLSADDVRAARDALCSTAVVLLSLGVPADCLALAIELARPLGARVVLDPSPPLAMRATLYAGVDVIRPNRSEARTLTGIDPCDQETGLDAATDLMRRGAGAACVQAGDLGDVLAWKEGGALRNAFLPRFTVDRVDATGAGDAFAGALSVCIAEGKALAEAGPFASAAAALATTVLGAQPSLPMRAKVLELLAAQR